MLIIGITGGTGSGKTTVVNQIVKHLPDNEVCVISQDSYYKATDNLSYEERTKINFDHPRAIDFDLIIKHLKELKLFKTIAQPVYSFVTHNRTENTVNNEELRNLFDIKIFVHADTDERLIRRVRRDIAERGRNIDEVLNRYQDTLKPMHQQFIEPTKNFADIIIPNDRHNTVAIDIVRTVINERL